jgi:hypothetical protein
VWELKNGQLKLQEEPKKVHAKPIDAVSVSPDGRLAFSCDSGGNLIIWKTNV